MARGLWAIVDESLAYSTASTPEFTSVLTLGSELKHLHNSLIWIYDIGEELSLHNLQLAVVYSGNEAVHKALKRLEVMQPCAPLVQLLAAELARDEDWTSEYSETKSHLLNQNRKLTIEWLDRMSIPYCKPRAGLSVFIDLREVTFHSEGPLVTTARLVSSLHALQR